MEIVIPSNYNVCWGRGPIRKLGQHKTKIIMCYCLIVFVVLKLFFNVLYTGFWQQNLKVSTTLAGTGYL